MTELFFYNFALEQFKLLHEIYKNLDDKINKMLTTILSIDTFLVALAYYLLKQSPSLIVFILFSLSFGCFTLGAIFGVSNSIPKKIEYTDALLLYNKYLNEPLNEILEITAVSIGDDSQKLRLQCINKAQMLKQMQVTIVIGIILLLCSFLSMFFFIN